MARRVHPVSALPLAAALALALLALMWAAAPAAAQNALDRSPRPGDTHTTNGYCLSPDVHDALIETLLNQGERAAMRAYQQAKTLGACRNRKVLAVYLKRTYRFPWPERPRFAGEQWMIRLRDSDRVAHILIMVQEDGG